MVPVVDIAFITEELLRIGDDFEQAAEESPDLVEPRPKVLITATLDLLGTLAEIERDTPAASAQALHARTGSEPEDLLNHGLDLLRELSGLATRLRQPKTARAIDHLALPLTCWLLRRGAELTHPDQVVNAAASLANGLSDPDALAELYALVSEVVRGLSPSIVQDDETPGTPRSWRVLLLNRAIVATRSHRPALMVDAFDSVCEYLPDAAPDFFREGMGQMQALDYPPQVREVMERYYNAWCGKQRLH